MFSSLHVGCMNYSLIVINHHLRSSQFQKHRWFHCKWGDRHLGTFWILVNGGDVSYVFFCDHVAFGRIPGSQHRLLGMIRQMLSRMYLRHLDLLQRIHLCWDRSHQPKHLELAFIEPY